jgi:hypothetical protein
MGKESPYWMIQRGSRFSPDDFISQLSKEEFDSLKSQIATSSSGWGGRRKPPLVFTEHGALQAANITQGEKGNPLVSQLSRN